MRVSNRSPSLMCAIAAGVCQDMGSETADLGDVAFDQSAHIEISDISRSGSAIK